MAKAMRNLFFTLILANLAFAAWNAWFTPQVGVQPVTASDVSSIQLASEVEPGESVERAEPTTANGAPASEAAPVADSGVAADAGDTGEADDASAARDPAVAGAESSDDGVGAATVATSESLPPSGSVEGGAGPVTSCVSVGPFRELSQAATAAANLRASGFDPIQHAGEGDVWVGYWVYIEQIPTQADANEILSVLRKNGVTDSYVIPNTDRGSLVSLGVFTEIARAGNRRAQVRELGYDATISDRTRHATVYWVDVKLGAGQALDFDLLQPPGRIGRLEQRPCESAPR
jgi:SPOR domain